MPRKLKVIVETTIATSLLVFAASSVNNREIAIQRKSTTLSENTPRVAEVNIEYTQDIKEVLRNEYGVEFDGEIDDDLGRYLLSEDSPDGKVTFIINKVDTTAPILPEIEDITLTSGQAYDAEEQIASIEDDLDGTLDITYEGEVNASKVGSYTIAYFAEDSSGNISKDEYTVTVKPKPVIRTASTSTTATGSDRPDNTLYFEGRLVYYSNGSSDVNVVQSALDSSPGVAKIYSIVGGNYHSGNDGVTTYFSGHEYSAFSSVSGLTNGEVITVKTGGEISTYTVTDRFVITAAVNSSGTRNASQSFYDRISAVAYSETIILQTCVKGSPQDVLVIIATKQ